MYLKFWKTDVRVILPVFATEHSACFDIAYQPFGKQEYSGFARNNKPFTRPIPDGSIVINGGDRVLVPTGLIMDIPEGYSVRLHPRSGLSYKQGLVLANAEAVIDSDYFHELFVLLHNISDNQIKIMAGDRVAQAELVQQVNYQLLETFDRPTQKTSREGGLGSTGVSVFKPEDIIYTTPETPVKRGRGRPRKTPK